MSSSRSRSRSRSQKNRRSKITQKTEYGLKIPSNAKKYLKYDENGREIWEIENILDERIVNGNNEYLVKWEGWPYRFCTWEPEENFFENMDIIKDFVKEKNSGRRRLYKLSKDSRKRTQSKSKPQTPKKEYHKSLKSKSFRPSRKLSINSINIESDARGRPGRTLPQKTRRDSSRTRSRSRSKRRGSVETKVIIQRITLASQTGLIEVKKGNVMNGEEEAHQSSISYINTTSKPIDVFVCREAGDLEAEMTQNKKETPTGKRSKNKTLSSTFENFDPQDRESDSDFEDMNNDKMSVESCYSHKNSVMSEMIAPIMENELEKISDFRIIVEECFTFLNNVGQKDSLRFKVAFYDNENNLKGYDYYGYEDMKIKNWGSALLDFYTREIISEVSLNRNNLTDNIKAV